MHKLTSCLVASLFLFDIASAHDHATATYLGNEGVLVSHGDTKILFDAFYAEGFRNYTLVPDDIASAMLKGEPPYDGVDAIFVSHVHGDHFTAAPAIAYLRAHPSVELYGSVQVKEAILKAGIAQDDPVMARIHGYDIAPEHDPVVFDMGGLMIDVVAVPHTGNWTNIQNFAWRVTLDDKATVMHLGDADPVVSNFSRHMEHFKKRKTNTAFPPYWFIGDKNGKIILDDIIGADQAIGIHVPKRAYGKGDEWRKNAGGDLYTDPGETRTIPDE